MQVCIPMLDTIAMNAIMLHMYFTAVVREELALKVFVDGTYCN